ncbi:ABC transporter permease [Craterilacuibacter sinensis]|uniref:ABC transporter permease subunit n=1 Tax=Craterilacuibacter sinensis TaxID=2686017 RepID=A0A845BTX6_9NEIS|nr:ABC transporter permease subunit [Craterilacuibacter sinensis]MXR37616.1 ABC transporter permease subunit [Craterilacuibacter sinensis]
MDFSWFSEYHPQLWLAALTTVQLLLVSGSAGFVLAILVGFGRLSKQPFIAWFSLSYTNLIRGTPLLVQIYVLYYGLGSLFQDMPTLRDSILWPYLREGFWYVALALTLSVGGYLGEVLKSGLRAVPKGGLEAARALGMPRLLVIRRIWLPQTLYMLLPTLAGESVMLLKSTALASTVAVMDALGVANLIRNQTFLTYEPLLIIAGLYLLLAIAIEQLFKRLESRLPFRNAL